MKYGVCGDLSVAATAARTMYDYAEWNVAALMRPLEPEEAFLEGLVAWRSAELPYPVAKNFLPGDLKVTGPDADLAELKRYVLTTLKRAGRLGVEIIVFGSGVARQIPEGFSADIAHEQLLAFCRMVAPLAHDHGVTVVIEPLNRKECNVLNTVSECAALVNEVAHPGIRLLVDAYHLLHDGDSCESIVTHGALLAHAHIATFPNRFSPAAEECDFSGFFAALARAGYKGRISIEGKINNSQSELSAALNLMRSLENCGIG